MCFSVRVTTLKEQEIEIDNIPEGAEGHEANFDQLVSLFEDASDHYGEYEEARLAEVIWTWAWF